MTPQPSQPPKQPGAAVSVDELLAADLDVTDEEADEEIDLVDVADAQPSSTPQAVVAESAEPTTPSVRVAVDKAADMMRELRGN